MTPEELAAIKEAGAFKPASLIGPGVGAVGSVLGAYMQIKAQEEQFAAEMAFREKEFQQQKKMQDLQAMNAGRAQDNASANASFQLNVAMKDRAKQQTSVATMLKGLGAK